MSIRILNILSLIDEYGEEVVREMIASYRCSLNTEIENFLLKQAVDFTKKKISITYLVVNDDDKILAYFTLTHKSTWIPIVNLSKTTQKHLARFASFNKEEQIYNASAFLIAQFGKNSMIAKDEQISGNALMDLTQTILLDVQRRIGGGIVFLECEDNERLLKFYSDNNFKSYAWRYSREGINYHQMLCVL